MFQTLLEELCAFPGITILMDIHKLPKMRDYWSIDEGLGNTLIQKNDDQRSIFGDSTESSLCG